MGALVVAVRHAMIQFFVAFNKPALEKYKNAEVHHNTPPFVKLEQTFIRILCAKFDVLLRKRLSKLAHEVWLSIPPF